LLHTEKYITWFYLVRAAGCIRNGCAGFFFENFGVPALYRKPMCRRVPQSLLLRRHYLRPAHATGES
ncbi:MAG: hypothetical protein KAX50_05340, partial [Saprospiraceae bacterium]|nr:hypothetical protein [Saprospiraceae bacterium]